jgi:tRNA pseudouridine32 synthase/23S rRNA pseudouridine746 synthase
VLHADAWIVVVEKPPGIPSVPARDPREPSSLIDRLRLTIDGFVEAVHRLDRDTSGLIVVARSVESRRRLGMAFERGEVDKRYVAVVEGGPPSVQGTLHLPIAKASGAGPRYRADPILGVRAATRWRLLQTSRGEVGGRSLLELEPITGRSHQLRVHLAWLGSPIVGDPLYGKRSVAAGDAGRLARFFHGGLEA